MYLSKRDQGLCYWKTVNRYFVSSCQNPLVLQSDREASSVDISEHAPRCNCIQTQRKNEWVTTKQNVVIVARASAEGSTFGRKSGNNGARFFPFRRENRKQLLPVSLRKAPGWMWKKCEEQRVFCLVCRISSLSRWGGEEESILTRCPVTFSPWHRHARRLCCVSRQILLGLISKQKKTTGSIVSPSTTIRSVWMVMIWGTVW